ILVKQDEVLGGYSKDDYHTERVTAKAHDGEDIYISLVYSKNIDIKAMNPLLLYAYGSYGIISEPSFRYSVISLLDRGVVFGIAHVRGSSLKGRDWYEKGKLLFKKNTFYDFISCAKHLIAEKYTSKNKLGIIGGSAGGLLVGAVVNMAPDLIKSAIADVPFVDVINTMLDDTLPLTVIEYDEWGNPNDKEFYDYMKSYSPYDNVTSKQYPDILVMAGLNDPRVQYWEPAKWTAKLREKKAGNSILLLKTNLGSGHFGETGRYNVYKEVAFKYAFFLDSIGIKE
ncbi:MAG: prolyl oligopeptidase family serine peptidase, partial [Candidatus Hodarchaeales archaeon]